MDVHRAYSEWRAARDVLLSENVCIFSEEFYELARAADRKLHYLMHTTPESPAEAALKLEAVLSSVDLPEPVSQTLFDTLAWLKAQ